MPAVSLIAASLLALSSFLGTPRAMPLHRYCIVRSVTRVTKVYDHNKKLSQIIREKILLTEDKDAPDSVVLHVENLDIKTGIRWTRLYYPRDSFLTFLQQGKPLAATRAIVKQGDTEAVIPLSSVQRGSNILEEVFPLLAAQNSPQKETRKWNGKSLHTYRYAVDTTREIAFTENVAMIEHFTGKLWMAEEMPFGLFKGDLNMDITLKGRPGTYQIQHTRFQVLSVGEEK